MSEDVLGRLRRLEGLKWSRDGPDVVPCWVADMDLGVPPAVSEVLRRLVDAGDLGYGPKLGPVVAEAFCERQERLHGWAPDPTTVRVLDDVVQGIEVALWTGTAPGDGVVIHPPVYPPFAAAVRQTGRRLIEHPMVFDGTRFVWDPAAWEPVAAEVPRAVVLCNPHNPTGRVFDSDELERLGEWVLRHDLFVVSDEIHADLVHPGHRHVPFASLSDELARRTVTLSSASKSHNLAGLRCAVAVVGAQAVRDGLAALPPHVPGASNVLGLRATLAAWRDGGGWLDDTRRVLTANRDRLFERFAAEAPGVGGVAAEGTYLVWLDVSSQGLGDRPAERLRTRHGVAPSEGADFGTGGQGWIRVNVATPPPVLEIVLDRLIAAFDP